MRRPVLCVFLSAVMVGCSASSAATEEGLLGGLTGGAIGAGIGAYYANKLGNTAENLLLNTALGAGAGIIAGAMLHEINTANDEQRALVVRQAALVSENQRNIDQLRNEMRDASIWGRAEVKEWNERYWDENPNNPYQGPTPK